jgi:predicted outer membrane repeat protein
LGEGTGGAMLQAADSSQVVNAIMKAIELAFAPQNPIYIEGGCTLSGWRADSNTWDPNTHNIGKDPNFVVGYYLSQIAAGQDINSPCVNAGSDLASVLGMDTYTTRTDGIFDANIVDMGYHYRHGATTYTLTAVVIGGHGTVEPPSAKIHYGYENNVITLNAIPDDGYRLKKWTGTDNDYSTDFTNTVTLTEDRYVTVEFEMIPMYSLTATVIGGHGSIDPTGGTYPGGSTVILTATPDTDYRVKRWNGTDKDSSTAKTNEVTMDSNTVVTVEFEHTQVLYVGDGAHYPRIQDAIDASKEGDTIIISEANQPYVTSWGYTVNGKNLTITSAHPDDPCCVARTVIRKETGTDGSGWSAFRFYNVGPETVINGLTIERFGGSGYTPPAPTAPDIDGENGGSVYGGAIMCGEILYTTYDGNSFTLVKAAGSPTIKNCVIKDCNLWGGSGANGLSGTATHFAGGDGGWPGGAFGAGISIRFGSSPAIINCTFRNCTVTGGNGGDGGTGNADPWGQGGRGGGWTYGESSYYWYNASWTYGYPINGSEDPCFATGYYDIYTKYSGHGGAVYVGPDCAPKFENCTFVNNHAQGGTNGIAGLGGNSTVRDEPSIHWKIPNSGGAVYCDSNSFAEFTGCRFINNTADVNAAAPVVSSFVSFGGAIAFEEGAAPVIKNCDFSYNNATGGGAIFSSGAQSQISDSNFIENTAYNGGALYCVDSNLGMANCNISGNQAAFPDSNDPNVPATSIGLGGSIYCNSSDAQIYDCNIRSNIADGSGGGVYFGGQGDFLLHNCLLADNITGRDGGGVSVNWYSNLVMANCTLANNMATGVGFGASYGGGLYCSYQSYTSVIDSILWNNSAGIGAQIAIGTGFEYDKRPSVVDVNYSDVQGGAASVYVDIGNPSSSADDCKLNWSAKNLTGTSLANPKFVMGFYLSQPITGEPNQSALGLSICVDKGSTTASLAGLYRHTTRTDSVPEVPDSIVDMGYHYVLTTNLVGDFNFDKYVNFFDYILFADHFLDTDCEFPDWCYGTDLDRNGVVNWGDFAIFAENYGVIPIKEPNDPNSPINDHTPPSPNPMTWASVPTSAGATSITMTATTATDNSTGPNVEYYFQRTDANGVADGTIRTWGTSASYTDNTAVNGRQYGYRVKARDKTVNLNETGWSVIGYATAGSTPGVPAAPGNLIGTAVSATQINLSWNDNSSNETMFKIERKTGSGSFTQIATTVSDVKDYNNTGLTAATAYSYRVRAYNGSGDSAYSNIVDVNTTTAAADGNQLPTPSFPYNLPPAVPVDGNNSGQTKLDPNGSISSYWWHKIVTIVPTGTPLVYYRFVCTNPSGFSSQWVPSNGIGNVVYPKIIADYPNPVVKYGANVITYCVPVSQGTIGSQLDWQVDVSFYPTGSGSLPNKSSATKTIYAP